MRQSSVFESKRYAFSLNVLLADASNNLGYINLRAFGTGYNHGLEVVKLGQRLLGRRSRVISGLVQDLVHMILERLTESVSGRGHQFIVVRLLDYVNDLFFGLLDRLSNRIVGVRVGNGVADTNRMALYQQPVVYHSLNVAVEFAALFMTVFHEYQVNERAGRCSQCFFTPEYLNRRV